MSGFYTLWYVVLCYVVTLLGCNLHYVMFELCLCFLSSIYGMLLYVLHHYIWVMLHYGVLCYARLWSTSRILYVMSELWSCFDIFYFWYVTLVTLCATLLRLGYVTLWFDMLLLYARLCATSGLCFVILFMCYVWVCYVWAMFVVCFAFVMVCSVMLWYAFFFF